MKFSFLGVGALSTPMIENFLADGHDLTVWNRSDQKSQPLAAKGATVVQDAIDAIEPGGVVMSCLANDQALDEVFGDGLLFEKLGNGGIHVSMSTCSPTMSERLADNLKQHGGQHLSCPVLGRPDFVEQRMHRYAISGNAAAIERVRATLAGVSDQIFVVGDDAAAASIAKVCTNYLIASAVEVMAESLSLAIGSGADAEVIRKMWNETLFPGVVYTNYSRQILDRKFEPLFALSLMLKDVGLFTDAADKVGVDAPIAVALRKRFAEASERGLGKEDFTAVSKLAIP